MVHSGGHLRSDVFEKFISFNPYYTLYMPFTSSKSIQRLIRYCSRKFRESITQIPNLAYFCKKKNNCQKKFGGLLLMMQFPAF